MDHFDIILALSRMALNGDDKRVSHQVTRLRDALKESDPKQAEKLGRLLSRQERKQDVAPMALERMRANSARPGLQLPGETISRSTPLPHDKETGTALARIVFPDDHTEVRPILGAELEAAIGDLLREWDRVEALAAMGVQPNMRCLIYGAPGVGKTLLARYIGQRLGLPLVEARLDGLVSSFLGTTARNIGALFDFADRYRCILFLDEFDAVAKARDDSHEVGEIKRVVNTLLQSLDARSTHGFTIAATNHEHLLDPAVWRRFEARIRMPLPEPAAREQMLSRFLEPVRLTDAEMKLLVWLTDGMSGADIETLVAGGKRYLVLHSENGQAEMVRRSQRGQALLAALRRQATLNARLFDQARQALLLGPEEELLDAVIEGASLTQKDAAELTGVSQSTVSRRLKSNPQPEPSQKLAGKE
jgi:SpoVK/Ycf46/Vps4 family AAA+-type ATPase